MRSRVDSAERTRGRSRLCYRYAAGLSREGRARSLVTVVVWLGCAGSAAAETKTWVGGGGRWDTPANWSPAGVPSATDDAVIASGDSERLCGGRDRREHQRHHGLAREWLREADRQRGRLPRRRSPPRRRVDPTGTCAWMVSTTWSAGSVQLWDAGVVENAGVLVVPAAAGVSLDIVDNGGAVGARVLRVLAGGVVDAPARGCWGRRLRTMGRCGCWREVRCCSRAGWRRRRIAAVRLWRRAVACCR